MATAPSPGFARGSAAGPRAHLARGSGRSRLARAPRPRPSSTAAACPAATARRRCWCPASSAPTGTCSSSTAGWPGSGYRSHLAHRAQRGVPRSALAALLETVERARDATGRPVHLIGHSLGGMLTRSLADPPARPGRVGRDARLPVPRGSLAPAGAAGLRAGARAGAPRRPARLLHRVLPLRGGHGPRGGIPRLRAPARGVHADRRHRGLAHVAWATTRRATSR